jgi:hypothetical protein
MDILGKSISKVYKYAPQSVLIYTALWALASVFAVSFQCSPDRHALGPGNGTTCVDQFALHAGIRVTDAISEIAVVLLPIFVMWKLQTTLQKRLLVIALFSTRLL